MNCRWRQLPDQIQTGNQPVGRHKKLCRPAGFPGTSTDSSGSRHRQEMYRPKASASGPKRLI